MMLKVSLICHFRQQHGLDNQLSGRRYSPAWSRLSSGTEDMFKCIKMRVEVGREWQRGANEFKLVTCPLDNGNS